MPRLHQTGEDQACTISVHPTEKRPFSFPLPLLKSEDNVFAKGVPTPLTVPQTVLGKVQAAGHRLSPLVLTFLLPRLGARACFWHQAGPGRGCRSVSYTAQDDPPTKDYPTLNVGSAQVEKLRLNPFTLQSVPRMRPPPIAPGPSEHGT